MFSYEYFVLDILWIPITSVASECAFSMGCRVLDSFRSSLSNPMIEALICTQDWFRTSDMEINFDDDLESHDKLGKGKLNHYLVNF